MSSNQAQTPSLQASHLSKRLCFIFLGLWKHLSLFIVSVQKAVAVLRAYKLLAGSAVEGSYNFRSLQSPRISGTSPESLQSPVVLLLCHVGVPRDLQSTHPKGCGSAPSVFISSCICCRSSSEDIAFAFHAYPAQAYDRDLKAPGLSDLLTFFFILVLERLVAVI